MLGSGNLGDTNQNIYVIENIYCGTVTANDIYKEAIKKILIKD